MKKKILVTGGLGFIGWHLVNELQKHNEVVIADKKNGYNVNNSEILMLFDRNKFDTIFHLAANSDIQNSDPYIEYHDTFNTTISLLHRCVDCGIKEFVFASSSAVYGEHEKPMNEDSGPCLPISFYGAAKLASEGFISAFTHQHDIKSWILRFPNVVGDHATHGVLYDLIRKHKKNPHKLEVLGDGSQLKPYIHVSELVEAMIYIWMTANEKVNLYNISGIGRTSVKEIAEMITDKDIIYSGGEAWKGDCKQYLYDTKKLMKLGWVSKINSNLAVEMAIREIWTQLENI